jgi:hypothetical protein
MYLIWIGNIACNFFSVLSPPQTPDHCMEVRCLTKPPFTLMQRFTNESLYAIANNCAMDSTGAALNSTTCPNCLSESDCRDCTINTNSSTVSWACHSMCQNPKYTAAGSGSRCQSCLQRMKTDFEKPTFNSTGAYPCQIWYDLHIWLLSMLDHDLT